MKQYRCVPIAAGLPIVFAALALCHLYCALAYEGAFAVFMFSFVAVLGLVVYTGIPAIDRVEIYADRIICKRLLPKDTFSVFYETCNIGMDYHFQNGNKIWWIYFCEGPLPRYKGKNAANRINTGKIKPGFIKIMYSDEVYEALMAVLPKKQQTALLTSRRCANFGKQGSIFF